MSNILFLNIPASHIGALQRDRRAAPVDTQSSVVLCRCGTVGGYICGDRLPQRHRRRAASSGFADEAKGSLVGRVPENVDLSFTKHVVFRTLHTVF
jgi:hypothetical protein